MSAVHPLAVGGLPFWLLLHMLFRAVGPFGVIAVVVAVLVVQSVARRGPRRW
jgi:hypothetical protein